MRIAHACHDENGRYYKGKRGDQTTREVTITAWYDRPFTEVYRAKEPAVAEAIAQNAENGAKNDYIGYSMNDRNSCLLFARSVRYDLSKIKKPCNVDCSSFVMLCVLYSKAGMEEQLMENDNSFTTSNEWAKLSSTKNFIRITKKEVTGSDRLLKRGDILCYPGHHTAVALDNGSAVKVEPSLDIKPKEESIDPALKALGLSLDRSLAGTYETLCALNLRKAIGIQNLIVAVMSEGESMSMNGYYGRDTKNDLWYYVNYCGKFGFCSAKYLRKVQ